MPIQGLKPTKPNSIRKCSFNWQIFWVLSSQPAIINLQSNKGTQQSFGYVETYMTGQKELYEKMLASKDEEITRLYNLLEMLAKK